jgi:hypothetical protein
MKKGGEDRDPAWITCALAAASIPLFDLLVLAPAASVATNPLMEVQPAREREAWMTAFGRRSWVGLGLAATAFGCMLLVTASPRGEAEGAGGGLRRPF